MVIEKSKAMRAKIAVLESIYDSLSLEDLTTQSKIENPQFISGEPTRQEFIGLYSDMEKIVNDYNPKKEYPDSEKDFIDGLSKVKSYLKLVIENSEEEKVLETFFDENGEANETFKWYVSVFNVPLSTLVKSEVNFKEKVKKAYLDSLKVAYQLLNS